MRANVQGRKKKNKKEKKQEPETTIEETTELTFEEKHNVLFKPNEGPQTDFLAASEREVLYGGAAGGGKVRKGDGMHVDHRDGNPRNNSRSNLRVVPARRNRKKQ